MPHRSDTPAKPLSPLRVLRVALVVCALFTAACQSKPPRPAFVPAPPTGILTTADVDQPPRPAGILARPNYPVELRRASISGNARVRFIVTHDGRVIDVVVIHATHPDFGDAAAEAVSKWRYEPAIKDGQPIACLLEVPMVFNLNETRR